MTAEPTTKTTAIAFRSTSQAPRLSASMPAPVAHRICFNVLVNMMAVLREHGMLLASAKGPIPNVAELVVGEPIRGSWWAHPRSHEIYAVLNELADSPEVVRLRLIGGKITLVHRRMWPALVRLSDRFPDGALAAVDEQHTASGAHRTVEVPFPAWVAPEVIREAARLSEHEALDQMPAPALIADR